jgi:hypothetical protein
MVICFETARTSFWECIQYLPTLFISDLSDLQIAEHGEPHGAVQQACPSHQSQRGTHPEYEHTLVVSNGVNGAYSTNCFGAASTERRA